LVPANLCDSLAGYNLVSRDLSSSATMSPASGVGSGTGKETEQEVTLTDVVRCLTTIEEIVCLLQSVKDQLIVIEATVAEQGHQQRALNLVLTWVEHGQ
jgi:hypothetical protein